MIRRARLFFFAALLVAVVILVANFPLGALIQGRSAVRAESAQLVALQAENRALSSQVRALHDPATVGRIAHQEYGLITNPIPSSDLLPSDAILGPSARAAQPLAREPGFWHRVLDSLEFWHSLF
jgi:hypothetical protein